MQAPCRLEQVLDYVAYTHRVDLEQPTGDIEAVK